MPRVIFIRHAQNRRAEKAEGRLPPVRQCGGEAAGNQGSADDAALIRPTLAGIVKWA
jgi:hypothetical protein